MRDCKAVLAIGDQTYGCEEEWPHPGFAHRNRTAKASWCSDGEARAAQQESEAAS